MKFCAIYDMQRITDNAQAYAEPITSKVSCMKLDKKILLLLGVITVGLLFSLGANAYLLKEVTDIRIILDHNLK